MEPAYDCATASQCKEGGMSSIEVPTRGEVEDLLYREAALLDGWQLEDWLELLDALRRLTVRRRYQPDDVEQVEKAIRERFPEAEF